MSALQPGRPTRAAVLTALLALLAPLLAGCVGESPTRLTLQFTDATGLFRGNDVGIRGVAVGEVVEIAPSGGHVNVEIEVDPDVKIPADVGAVIVSRSVATDRYVELTPAYTAGPEVDGGSVIGVDSTRTPVELEQLLASLEDVSSALSGPEGGSRPLRDLLATMARNLDGQGVLIGQGLGDLATVFSAVEESLPTLETNLTNLDTLTRTLADNQALITQFAGQVSTATVMLDGQTAQIQATFDAVAAMLAALAEFSVSHKDQIGAQIDDFVALSQELLAHEADFTALLQNAPLMTQNLPRAIDDRGRMNFLTRPVDLLPGRTALQQLCDTIQVLCDDLDLDSSSIFDVLARLQGEGPA